MYFVRVHKPFNSSYFCCFNSKEFSDATSQNLFSYKLYQEPKIGSLLNKLEWTEMEIKRQFPSNSRSVKTKFPTWKTNWWRFGCNKKESVPICELVKEIALINFQWGFLSGYVNRICKTLNDTSQLKEFSFFSF